MFLKQLAATGRFVTRNTGQQKSARDRKAGREAAIEPMEHNVCSAALKCSACCWNPPLTRSLIVGIIEVIWTLPRAGG